MQKAIPYLLVFLICFSCKKEDVVVIVPASGTISIDLKIDQVINDSTIVLRWSKYAGANFQKYRLVRSATYLQNGQFSTYTEAVDSSTDINHLTFTETKMPYARDIYYRLDLVTGNSTGIPGVLLNASVYYQRPNSLVFGIPTDALIDKTTKYLYITELNKVSIIDYSSGRQLTSKEFPAGIGYCGLGNYSGSTELYVPVNDGWLQILDAATLQLKERIYIKGTSIGSVVAVSGKLYISSSDMSQGTYTNCVQVYDRNTKALIGRTGYWDQTRLLLLEGSAVEMIDLTIHIIPVDLGYYQFSATGVPVFKKQDTYHGDYAMDPAILRSFPDGSKFITSSSGTIFNKSLVFDRYVKQYGNFTDFAFSTDGSIIYCAVESQKKIDAIGYPALNNISSYPTGFYPYKIFKDGNTLIVVNKTNNNQQMTYILIEKINI